MLRNIIGRIFNSKKGNFWTDFQLYSIYVYREREQVSKEQIKCSCMYVVFFIHAAWLSQKLFSRRWQGQSSCGSKQLVTRWVQSNLDMGPFVDAVSLSLFLRSRTTLETRGSQARKASDPPEQIHYHGHSPKPSSTSGLHAWLFRKQRIAWDLGTAPKSGKSQLQALNVPISRACDLLDVYDVCARKKHRVTAGDMRIWLGKNMPISAYNCRACHWVVIA